ncbi:MAG: hypothetical protein DCO96_02690 [Fluviicola sp. XM-24bin1]|nr:MAG: hypothetical protein DCO96_02690 [Fluviicola sp. XM-24bin1]
MYFVPVNDPPLLDLTHSIRM